MKSHEVLTFSFNLRVLTFTTNNPHTDAVLPAGPRQALAYLNGMNEYLWLAADWLLAVDDNSVWLALYTFLALFYTQPQR